MKLSRVTLDARLHCGDREERKRMNFGKNLSSWFLIEDALYNERIVFLVFYHFVTVFQRLPFYGIVGDKGCRNVSNVETRVYVFMSIICIDVDHVEINLLIYAFVERKCDGNNFYRNAM